MNQERVRELADRVLNQERSNATEDQYRRMADRLEQAGQTPEEYARDRGLSKRSYYAYRAAWLHDIAIEAKVALKELDRARKAGNQEQVVQLRTKVSRLGTLLEDADPDRQHRHDRNEHPGYKPPEGKSPKTPRQAVRGLSRDWPSQVIQSMRPEDGRIAAVMAITGARPIEMARGGVYLRPLEEDRVEVYIEGAKTGEDYGQAWRRFVLTEADDDWFQDLLQRIGQLGRQGEWFQAPILTNPDAYRGRMRRAAKNAVGRYLTPYNLRHQFSSEAKRALGDDNAVSAALGHAADHTRRHYGLANQGRGLFNFVEVEAAVEVRSAKSDDPSAKEHHGPG